MHIYFLNATIFIILAQHTTNSLIVRGFSETLTLLFMCKQLHVQAVACASRKLMGPMVFESMTPRNADLEPNRHPY